MKEIGLSKGKITTVDDEDFEYLNQWKWHNNKNYACRTIRNPKKIILMHRIIMNAPSNLSIDHINGKTLDNRKNNLRLCTHKENIRNQKIKSNNTSGYKGVTWHKAGKKWLAQIKVDNKNIYLGLFANKKTAANAYDKAALTYFGEYAKLNKRKKHV